MSKKTEKLECNIEHLEREITDIILKKAGHASDTGEDIFTNSDYNPHNILSAHFHQDAVKLLSLANESINLQEQALIDATGSISQLYLTACLELADLTNEQRRGPRKLAEWLFQEVSKQNAL